MKPLQLFFASMLLVFAACKNDDVLYTKLYPRVVTLQVVELPNHRQLFSGRITLNSDHAILKHGFVWSHISGPQLDHSFKMVVDGAPAQNDFSVEVATGFFANTNQFVRAFVQTAQYVVYGPEVQFRPTQTGNVLADFSPKTANIGEPVTITGHNFQQLPSGFKIFFGEIEATIHFASNGEIKVIIPAGLVTDRNVAMSKAIPISLRLNGANFFLMDQPLQLEYPGTWTRLSAFPGTAGRSFPISFTIGERGYFGFGSSDDCASTVYGDFWKYDPHTDTWTEIPTPVPARTGAVSFVFGTKAYLVGGFSGAEGRKDVWEFDASTETWARKSDYPGLPRMRGFSFVNGANGYYGAGYQGSNNCISQTPNYEFWRFDPANDTWIKLAQITAFQTTGAVAASYQNRSFVLGSVNQLFEFNPGANTFVFVSQVPFTTYTPLSSFTVNDVLSFGSTHVLTGRMIFQFNLSTMEWENRTINPAFACDAVAGFGFDTHSVIILKDRSTSESEIWRLEH